MKLLWKDACSHLQTKIWEALEAKAEKKLLEISDCPIPNYTNVAKGVRMQVLDEAGHHAGHVRLTELEVRQLISNETN